ncbi:AraC family transcriptional regulator [Arachidicoccus terrestris]|uniref:AraC family transcriptional regulator n=1 Tax=Arachidicoccus terrestris TaxID=2875539 RepID=UPI001CC3556F|nr:AraC family transcriptional regulator [Arachidicoccus terrestris]UAY56873.1 AraC family transcriptional regulator [Arachidicoccus terrestris]
MSTYQNTIDHVCERSVQFTNDVYVHFLAECPFPGQFFITSLTHLPKATHYHRYFKKGTDFNILIYCTSGSGWCSIGDSLHTLHPNQYVLIPATELPVAYGVKNNDFWGVYITHFDGCNISYFNDSSGINPSIRPVDIGVNRKGIEIWEEMYRLLSEEISSSDYAHANFCLYHFLASFLFPSSESKKNEAENWVQETIVFMEEMIREKLSVEDLAERLNLSVSYFSALFRKATGIPPLEYFIQLKLQNACRLLKERGLKVKDVADAIGYDDPFHFSRLFKKHMKMSPLAYKSSGRPDNRPVISELGQGMKVSLLAG